MQAGMNFRCSFVPIRVHQYVLYRCFIYADHPSIQQSSITFLTTCQIIQNICNLMYVHVHVSGCMRWFYEDYLELAPSALLNTFDWILKCRRCPPSLNQPLSSFPLFSKLHRPYVMLCKWSLYEWYGIFNCTFSF